VVSSFRTIHHHHCHYTWDNAQEPVARIAPGETLTFDVKDASDGQITPGSRKESFTRYDAQRVNPVTGPIFVDGADPGDVLVIRLEDYAPSGWGWTANIPGFGLLADDFRDPALLHWNYAADESTPLLFGSIAEIPLAPFAGTIGVAPAEPGAHTIIPPRRVGGNMDIRDLVAGSVLYLPIEVSGALLSIGDTHAAQGDGEVCGTAIESPMRVTVTVDVLKDQPIAMPRLLRPERRAPEARTHVWVTSGIGPDLIEAARTSVREMIELLMRAHGIAAVDAYMLCSVAGDLRISQIVDAPNWTVTFHLPDGIFATRRG
jgi:acetamidase/formamidase